LRWLHGGWIAALGLGVLTWIVSNYLVEISGATRELTEGITALTAAAVLFYVGFWMHSKLNARRWQAFIQSSVRAALDRRSLWALAGIAFVAAYREVFETVLFFQALWVQSSAPAASRAVLGGFAAGAALIVAIAWAIFRFGLRLPLKQFFAVSAAIMIALAVIFVGKGVAALQEAGKLPLDPVDFPRIDVLGIYPNWQSLAAQLLVLAAALALVVFTRRTAQ
jgi:high-affinity iron transporter